MANDRRELLLRNQILLPWSPGRTVSTARAAELLGCSQTLIRTMIEDGSLQAYKLHHKRPGSPYRIYVDSLKSHMAKVCAEFGLDA